MICRYLLSRTRLLLCVTIFGCFTLALLMYKAQQEVVDTVVDVYLHSLRQNHNSDQQSNLVPEKNIIIVKEPPRKKKILAWTKFFGKEFNIIYSRKILQNDHAFEHCSAKNCEWTINRQDINSSDAVLFHVFIRDFRLDDLPIYRTPNQHWVFFNLEAPIRFQEGMMGNLDGVFNLTATYEDDADISVPYGFYYKRDKPLLEKSYLPDMSTKKKPIIWMVSRCNTISRREVYAAQMKKYIDVDIIGACGRPAPNKGTPPINLDFRKELAKEYYFYLAFENSNCQDYITEKFWSALLAGLVPIVRGQFPRYEKHAPPGSYINADAFFSYQDLAQYLNYLIEHPEEYEKYFKWKEWYSVTSIAAFANLDVHCRLCAYLNSNQSLIERPAYKMSERYSSTERCYNYHHNLPNIQFELDKAYDDEFKGFLPIK